MVAKSGNTCIDININVDIDIDIDIASAHGNICIETISISEPICAKLKRFYLLYQYKLPIKFNEDPLKNTATVKLKSTIGVYLCIGHILNQGIMSYDKKKFADYILESFYEKLKLRRIYVSPHNS